MKANRFFPHQFSFVALTAFLLSVSSLQAQTFTGAKDMSDVPPGLEAVIYPLSNFPSTIKVIFNNHLGGSVRIVIRNESGKEVYEEFTSMALYRRRFDLSSLPEGHYTVELSKKDEHFTQTFSIDSPERSRIAMENSPVRLSPNKPTNTKLVVNKKN